MRAKRPTQKGCVGGRWHGLGICRSEGKDWDQRTLIGVYQMAGNVSGGVCMAACSLSRLMGFEGSSPETLAFSIKDGVMAMTTMFANL